MTFRSIGRITGGIERSEGSQRSAGRQRASSDVGLIAAENLFSNWMPFTETPINGKELCQTTWVIDIVLTASNVMRWCRS